jgi:hypothetical protein
MYLDAIRFLARGWADGFGCSCPEILGDSERSETLRNHQDVDMTSVIGPFFAYSDTRTGCHRKDKNANIGF